MAMKIRPILSLLAVTVTVAVTACKTSPRTHPDGGGTTTAATTVSTDIDRKFIESLPLEDHGHKWKKNASQKCSDPGQSLTFTCPGTSVPLKVSQQGAANDIHVVSGQLVRYMPDPIDEYCILDPEQRELAKLFPASGRFDTVNNGDMVIIRLQKAGASPELRGELVEEGILFILDDGNQFVIGNLIIRPSNENTIKLIRETFHYQKARLVFTVTQRRSE